MPVRSLRSSVLRWPDRDEVHRAVAAWADHMASARDDVVSVGYFGSYARGDWGVGSDVDIVVVVTESAEPFIRRAVAFETAALPVEADVLVYTRSEWDRLRGRNGTPARAAREMVWVLERDRP